MANGITEILDSVRRIIERWVNTYALLQTDASPGDTVINVKSTTRFERSDEILLTNDTVYETDLYIKKIVDDTHIELTTPINFEWKVSDNAMARKAIYGNIVQGVYIGDPSVIPQYPAITVAPDSRSSEWLTLESTTERYALTINIYVQDSTDESSNRFLYKMTDIVQEGLKRNIFPLVNDYNVTAITQNASAGDYVLYVADSDAVKTTCARVRIEDPFKMEETAVTEIIDATSIRLARCLYYDYDIDDNPIVISPERLIYNSWPESIDYKMIQKDSLLKAASISWFAQEEEIRYLLKREPDLR